MSALRRAMRAIDEARRQLHEGTFLDRMAMLRDGTFDSYEEAVEDLDDAPAAATVEDVVATIPGLREHAGSIRAFVDRHGCKWAPHVRARWLVAAEELEDRAEQLTHETRRAA